MLTIKERKKKRIKSKRAIKRRKEELQKSKRGKKKTKKEKEHKGKECWQKDIEERKEW